MNYQSEVLAAGAIIPQDVYPPPQPYTRLPNVRFTVRGILGVKLTDAINPNYNGLDDSALIPRMSENAKKITLRIRVGCFPLWRRI